MYDKYLPPGAPPPCHARETLETLAVRARLIVVESNYIPCPAEQAALAHVLGCPVCLRAAGECLLDDAAHLLVQPLLPLFAARRLDDPSLLCSIEEHIVACGECELDFLFESEQQDLNDLAALSPSYAEAARLALALSEVALAGHSEARLLLLNWLGEGATTPGQAAAILRHWVPDHDLDLERLLSWWEANNDLPTEQSEAAGRQALAVLLRRGAAIQELALFVDHGRLAPDPSGEASARPLSRATSPADTPSCSHAAGRLSPVDSLHLSRACQPGWYRASPVEPAARISLTSKKCEEEISSQ